MLRFGDTNVGEVGGANPEDSQNFDQGMLQTKSLFDLLSHPLAKEDSKGDRLWIHMWRLRLRLRADEGKGCDSSYINTHKL